ncbi:MAG: VOC family protein [Campylobacterota bacterium]|nr:VOC family protein [Campylobacterota bacterium]
MRIDHINIVVAHIEKSEKFYIEVLGLEKTLDLHLEESWMEELTGFKKPSAKCVFLETPSKNCRIELLEYINPKTTFIDLDLQHNLNTQGIRHIAFEVDDIFDIYEKAKKYGVEFISKPVLAPLDIVPHGKALCYLKAPDGVILELAQYGKSLYNA